MSALDIVVQELVTGQTEEWIREHGGFRGFDENHAAWLLERQNAARTALTFAAVAGFTAAKDQPDYARSDELRLHRLQIAESRMRRETTLSPTEENAYERGVALAIEQAKVQEAAERAAATPLGAPIGKPYSSGTAHSGLLTQVFWAGLLFSPLWVPKVLKRIRRK